MPDRCKFLYAVHGLSVVAVFNPFKMFLNHCTYHRIIPLLSYVICVSKYSGGAEKDAKNATFLIDMDLCLTLRKTILLRNVKRIIRQFGCRVFVFFRLAARRYFFAAETRHKIRIIPYKRVNRAARYVTLISCGYARHNFVDRLVLFDRIFDKTKLRYYYVVLFEFLVRNYRNPLMCPTMTNGAKIHFLCFSARLFYFTLVNNGVNYDKTR